MEWTANADGNAPVMDDKVYQAIVYMAFGIAVGVIAVIKRQVRC
jgi:hypothetical protein